MAFKDPEVERCAHGFYLVNCDCRFCNPTNKLGHLYDYAEVKRMEGFQLNEEGFYGQCQHGKPLQGAACTACYGKKTMGPLCEVGNGTVLEIPMEDKMGFTVKDSGERQAFKSGMVRDTQAGKTDFLRVLDGPMLERWAVHLTKSGVKYPDIRPGVANWTLAAGEEELIRFKQSAFRHFFQWLRGDEDEDHAAGVYFNVNGFEYVKAKLRSDNGIVS